MPFALFVGYLPDTISVCDDHKYEAGVIGSFLKSKILKVIKFFGQSFLANILNKQRLNPGLHLSMAMPHTSEPCTASGHICAKKGREGGRRILHMRHASFSVLRQQYGHHGHGSSVLIN